MTLVRWDSRAYPLPPGFEEVPDGLRIRPGDVLRPTGQLLGGVAVGLAILTAVRRSGFLLVLDTVVAGAVVVAAVPVGAVWWRYRNRTVGPRELHRLGAVLAGLAGTGTAVGLALAAVAGWRSITGGGLGPGSRFLLAGLALTVPVGLLAGLASRTMRLARRVDPDTPGTRVTSPPTGSVWFTVDYGESGARFPKVLSLALVAPLVGAQWLAVVLGNLGYDRNGQTPQIVAMGTGLGLLPVLAGVAWWPWLRPALSGGLSAGQVRAVGLVYLVGGLVGGLVASIPLATIAAGEEAGNAFPGILGTLGAGALLAIPGRRLLGYARDLVVQSPPPD